MKYAESDNLNGQHDPEFCQRNRVGLKNKHQSKHKEPIYYMKSIEEIEVGKDETK
ncbi:25861_t:CDS:1, partial [Dentiscutata erythropus]